MKGCLLGATGLVVSELCLGTVTFGRECAEETCRRLLDRFAAAGGNFIDTADLYAHGAAEEIVGRWLAGRRREEWILATKVRSPVGSGPNEVGASRKHILAAIEASLRRLGTDYIDLYQVHAWDHVTPLEETLGTLDGLVRSGKVRYLGASNFAGWQLQKAIEVSRRMGWEPFRCLQPLYNLLDRSVEWELIPVCLNEGLGVLAWSPLRGGWLSGKYRRGMDAPPPQTRVGMATQRGWREGWAGYATEHTWRVVDALLSVGEEVGKTAAQVALNWLLRQPAITAPIVGARTVEQLDENLGAAGWSLAPAQVERLTQASAVDLPYPYYFLEEARKRR